MLMLMVTTATAQNKVLAGMSVSNSTYLTFATSARSLNFTNEAGSTQMSFTTNTNVDAKVNASWVKVEIADGVATVSVEANTGDSRETTIAIRALDGNYNEFSVRQLGSNPSFFVQEEAVKVNGQNVGFELNIITNSTVEFTLPEWVTAKNAPEGSGKYTFKVGEMAKQGNRTANITVKIAGDESSAVEIPVTQVFEGYPSFIVMSDTHMRTDDATYNRIKNSLQNLSDIAGDYDAIIVNGDLTDAGAADQYAKFQTLFDSDEVIPDYVERHYVMGNHEWGAGTSAMTNYLALGHEHNKYFDIKGYPFIYIGMSGGGEQNYSQESYDFLAASLADAADKYEGKPIFVFTHIPVYGTTHGSTATDGGWGNKSLYDILKPYPQVMHFCGHTHFSLRDERALWQGDFTSIDDGSNFYCYLNPGIDYRGTTPEGTSNVQEGLVVTVEDATNVCVHRVDGYHGEEIEPAWNFAAPYDGSTFERVDYTGGEAPYFDDANIQYEEGAANEIVVTWNQASDDDDIVLYYKVNIRNDKDYIVGTTSICSSFYLGPDQPETITVSLQDIPFGNDMLVEVIAYDGYGNASEPAQSERFLFGTYEPDPDVVAPTDCLFDMAFNDDNEVYDRSGNSTIVVGGTDTPAVEFNEEFNLKGAVFTGVGREHLRVPFTDAIREAIQNGFTFEVLFNITDLQTKDRVPMGAMDGGGTGYYINKGGTMDFYTHNGKWVYGRMGTLKAGTFYHCVATYDAAEGVIKTYIDGYPACEFTMEGEQTLPAREAAEWVGIGCDATSDEGIGQDVLVGTVLIARMYPRAITRDEVYRLYEEIENNKSEAGEVYDPTVPVPTADLADIVFGENGAATDQSPVQTVVRVGETTPETYYNETYKRWVAKFQNPSDNQEFYAIDYGTEGAIYDAMQGSFSLEVVAKLENPSTGLPAIFSSQQGGGLGIEPGNDIQIWGDSDNPTFGSIETGIFIDTNQYYHIIAVMDAENGEMRCYVDGEAAGSTPVGTMNIPLGDAKYFCIGGDAAMDGTYREYPMQGEVVLARIYGHALNLSEAKALYNSIIPED